jgi:hypothetical protein
VIAYSSWTADAGAPSAVLIPPQRRRSVGLLTRMAAHVLGELVDRTGTDASTLATVYATRYAEIGMMRASLSMAHGAERGPAPGYVPGVHDAAAGPIAVATGCRAATTTITAGPRTVAMALLEASAMLDRVAEEVAVVFVEEAVPEPFMTAGGYDGLAAAVLLRKTDDAPWCLENFALRPFAPDGRFGVPASVADNPCSPALTLVSAMRARRPGPVVLEAGTGDARRARWCVDVRSPMEPA